MYQKPNSNQPLKKEKVYRWEDVWWKEFKSGIIHKPQKQLKPGAQWPPQAPSPTLLFSSHVPLFIPAVAQRSCSLRCCITTATPRVQRLKHGPQRCHSFFPSLVSGTPRERNSWLWLGTQSLLCAEWPMHRNQEAPELRLLENALWLLTVSWNFLLKTGHCAVT